MILGFFFCWILILMDLAGLTDLIFENLDESISTYIQHNIARFTYYPSKGISCNSGTRTSFHGAGLSTISIFRCFSLRIHIRSGNYHHVMNSRSALELISGYTNWNLVVYPKFSDLMIIIPNFDTPVMHMTFVHDWVNGQYKAWMLDRLSITNR